jgi:hypothetical protein
MNAALANALLRRSAKKRRNALTAGTRQLIKITRDSIDDSVDRIAVHADRSGDDKHLVRLMAARIAAAQGKEAMGYLLSREVGAVGAGDRLSAEAWSDISTAVEEFLPPSRDNP